ncbi:MULTISPECIES: hypothetical protein [Halorussus]|uniref:hypothetical protein n=1 Tax=Halorussus TaxID=1070314 RepID=UPI000E212D30|nr:MULTISPECIES: hypothetical protein [Halorussus]NHN59363.1 hypothetical protein [Halorussus sp. JP-T4]
MSDDATSDAGEAHVDDSVLDRAADRYGVDAETVADALVVLHADLIGRHSEFEREYDHATVDDTRAYRVPGSVWDDLREEFDFEGDLADAVEYAHTEQARLAFADAHDADVRFEEADRGIVVGIDTAEDF